MKTENIWILNHCHPTTWTNDLTPPGDRDYALEPWEQTRQSLGSLFAIIGSAFSDMAKPIGKAVEHIGYHVAPVFDEIIPFFEDCERIQNLLTEDELVKNGRHIVKSQNPRIKLPTRYTNSGPPERRRRR